MNDSTKERLLILRSIVDAADVEAAKSEYAAKNGMPINGEVDCKVIREIFGWPVSIAAVAVKEALFG